MDGNMKMKTNKTHKVNNNNNNKNIIHNKLPSLRVHLHEGKNNELTVTTTCKHNLFNLPGLSSRSLILI